MIVKPKPIYDKLEFKTGVTRSMLSGVKRITIRKGFRKYTKNITIHGQPAIVERVKHTTLLHTDFTTLTSQGFMNMFSTLLILQEFYKDIDIHTPITLVEYRLVT